MNKINSREELMKFREELKGGVDLNKPKVSICGGTGCLALGAQKLMDCFEAELESRGLTDKVQVCHTGCRGFCERGPFVAIGPKNILYQKVREKNIPDIIEKSILGDEVVDELVYREPLTGEKILHEGEISFYKKQMRLVMGLNGIIDPESIEDYLSKGGYEALARVLEDMTPEKVVDEIIESQLRGRGGGGFPTGWKWDATRKAQGSPKYVICNADEGDPGAFMDRGILEGNPHSVLEGMITGAYAVGSNIGYIYVRNEYVLAVKTIGKAIDDARKYGFLGENILGTGFDFDIIINRGGGAFVCGESSALFASIEGRSGEPRAKYVHATDKGLFDKPTCLNNVETWANVPIIINRGAKAYAEIGTEKSKGTKIFSLVGKINNTGLVEVPMGITLREIVYEIGGGIPGDRKFKAVQTGGPSGGCIPEKHLDMPVDFDRLTELGSMMGSGGMIVMDDRNCMVDVARYFLKFLVEESCGKCTPCREGILQMFKILERITEGDGKPEDIETLEWMAGAISDGALCGLGTSAPNSVLSTIRYFKDEYLAHIEDKKCPAGVCKALIEYSINPDNCTGCRLCAKRCPADAVSGEKKEPHAIDREKCIKCGACFEACKFDAVVIE